MLVGTASFANTGDPVKKLPVVPENTEKVEKTSEVVAEEKVSDDAIHCKVTNGIDTYTCWFCNCGTLALSLPTYD